MKMFLALVVAFIAFLTVPAGVQEAGEAWTNFRGPGGRGLPMAENPNLPETWSTTTNVAWRTAVPGLGLGSPIVWDATVFVTAVTSEGDVEPPMPGLYRGGERAIPTDVHTWSVHALDLETGQIQWSRELHRGVPPASHHLKNTFASETPITDGERLYVAFGNVGIYCLDLTGTVLWSIHLEPLRMRSGWGTASSTALHDGRLYYVRDSDEQSSITAYSAETGAEIWRTARDEGSNWSTPFVWENTFRTEIVTTGADRVRSYDLDGHVLWELAGLSSITVPLPFERFNLLFVEAGYTGDRQRPVYAIRPGASGDISLADGERSNEFIAWSLPQGGTYTTSPLIYGDYYYTLLDRGMMTAHDARTGEPVYGRQRIRVGEGFSASPWAYNGKIFALSEEGTTYVIQAGPEFKIVGQNPLDEFTMSTPAILQDSLIIRTADHIYRIRNE